ncbi:MAG TPA: Rrf2 family transcriptional regulator [Candidatus Hydrogenedentes bacterium]|jgi:Rrf2 family protein|nr:Rrf2 family transcriptional regulator [Candidatus Hydrogenedentota bacterium]HPJ97856.1 Rrf2 family transcriptional regulator [Candidatus Hydrogenedentota bacterium]
MLTQTSETALRVLVFLLLREARAPVPPARIAQHINASPSYTAKVTTALVKADILRAHRGMKGGVTLSRPPEAITLLDVVEACQGKILGDFCQDFDRMELVCAFHRAMAELHEAIITILKRWTLADLAQKPFPSEEIRQTIQCTMELTLADDEDAAE